MTGIEKSAMIIISSLALTGCNSNMEIIAHRGASHLAPENTRAAAKLAWAKQADAVEVDVHLSRDGRIMVIHDSSTKRTAQEDMEVAETPADQLRRLDVGSFKSQAYAGEQIPLLEEIVATLPAERRLFVEIKCGPDVLTPLENLLRAHPKRDQIVIIGFDLDTVKASKKRMPDIPTYWLVGTKKDEETEAWIPHDKALVDRIAGTDLDGLNVHCAGITQAFAQHVRRAGFGLYSWTVNDPVEAKRLKRLGIQGITTDRPGWLREQL